MSALETPRRSRLDLQTPAEAAIRHAIEAVLQFFAWAHLPPHLQAVSRPFGDLALQIANTTSNAETTVALRKLLEAKDAAVRAVLFKDPGAGQGGKILVDCQCGGQIDIAAGPAAPCSACGRAMPSMSITVGHDTVIKAGDGPNGASIVITGGTLGPGSVVR